jgi:2-polyprenyl-3-methyl-5-hydroxy-6-metoxy-1,4-benzoquinol methylase
MIYLIKYILKKLGFVDNNHGTQIMNYNQKIIDELNNYNSCTNVHDLPKIYHYWSNKYILPMLKDAGYISIEDFFLKNLKLTNIRTNSKILSFLSIGSGNCDLEVTLCKMLQENGIFNFKFECLEINKIMLDRASTLIKNNNLSDKILLTNVDFNYWVSKKKYDAIIANHSLHHVSNLEHLFTQVKQSMFKESCFIINDMIGRNGHQRWPAALEIVHKYWNYLSSEKKYNHLLKRYENIYENWDCSKEGFEGIRAQDILPLLDKMLECEIFIGFGNVVDIFVDRCFGHNFNPDSEIDRNFIDSLHFEDEKGFAEKRLTPTHMLGVFTLQKILKPYFARGFSPKYFLKIIQK